MDHSALTILSQLLLVSLLIERIIAVGVRMFGKPASATTDDWDSWSKIELTFALVVACVICAVYNLDIFNRLLNNAASQSSGATQSNTVYDAQYFIGLGLTAVVLAGGSAGIQKIISALSASAKAYKVESMARLSKAYRLLNAATKSTS